MQFVIVGDHLRYVCVLKVPVQSFKCYSRGAAKRHLRVQILIIQPLMSICLVLHVTAWYQQTNCIFCNVMLCKSAFFSPNFPFLPVSFWSGHTVQLRLIISYSHTIRSVCSLSGFRRRSGRRTTRRKRGGRVRKGRGNLGHAWSHNDGIMHQHNLCCSTE